MSFAGIQHESEAEDEEGRTGAVRPARQAPALGWIVSWRGCGGSLLTGIGAGEGRALPGSESCRGRLACELTSPGGESHSDGGNGEAWGICDRGAPREQSLRICRCRLRSDRPPGTEIAQARPIQVQDLEGDVDTHGQAGAQKHRPPALRSTPLDSDDPHTNVLMPGPTDCSGCYTGCAALSTLASAHAKT